MLGCGVVGSEVARLLLADTDELSTRAGVKIELARIAVRTMKPYEGINPAIFTTDPKVIAETPEALRWVFAASPIIAVQLIGAAYFQAAGKAKKALFLTLSKQGFFLIPLVLILPNFLGIFGVWVAFPIADVLSTLITGYFLKKEMNINLIQSDNGLL